MKTINYLFIISFLLLGFSFYAQTDTSYFNNAEGKLASGKYKDAIKDYSSAINLNPKYIAAYKGRGICLYQLQQGKNAIADFNRVIATDTITSDTYYYRGACKKLVGDTTGYRLDWDRAVYLGYTLEEDR
jgi:tetratricopeptide (TPR) repeat protein